MRQYYYFYHELGNIKRMNCCLVLSIAFIRANETDTRLEQKILNNIVRKIFKHYSQKDYCDESDHAGLTSVPSQYTLW